MLVDKLLADNTVVDSDLFSSEKFEYAKAKSFARLFDMDPDSLFKGQGMRQYIDCSSKGYSSKDFTKEQIRNRLVEDCVIEDNFLGKIKLEIKLKTKFYTSGHSWYYFLKRNWHGVKYQLRWDFEVPDYFTTI